MKQQDQIEKKKIEEMVINKRVDQWESDLFFFTNKLLKVYGGIVRRIDKGEDITWKGKYPSPLEKAINDIHDLFHQAMKQEIRKVGEKLKKKSYHDPEIKGDIFCTGDCCIKETYYNKALKDLSIDGEANK